MIETGSTVTRKRISLGIIAPAALLLLAIVLWSFVWLSAASRASEAIEQWRRDAEAEGARLSCAQESTGGYPFRLEFECTQPALTVAAGGAVHTLNADRLRAIAQVYDTGHIIVELDAPARIGGPVPEASIVAAASGVIRASIELEDGRLSRLSAVLPGWTASTGTSGSSPAGLGSERSEIHLRTRPQNDALDVAISAERAFFDDGAPERRIGVDRARIVAVINRPQPASLATANTWLARWRDAGGVADIRSLTFDSPSLAGEGAGAVNLTARSYLEGALNVRLAKLDKFVGELEAHGILSGPDADLLKGGAQLFAKKIDGQTAVTLPVRIRDGEIWLGPVKIWALPAFG